VRLNLYKHELRMIGIPLARYGSKEDAGVARTFGIWAAILPVARDGSNDAQKIYDGRG